MYHHHIARAQQKQMPPSDAKGCLYEGTESSLGLSQWCHAPNTSGSSVDPSKKGFRWVEPSGSVQCDKGGQIVTAGTLANLCSTKYPGNTLYKYPKPAGPGGSITISCCPH